MKNNSDPVTRLKELDKDNDLKWNSQNQLTWKADTFLEVLPWILFAIWLPFMGVFLWGFTEDRNLIMMIVSGIVTVFGIMFLYLILKKHYCQWILDFNKKALIFQRTLFGKSFETIYSTFDQFNAFGVDCYWGTDYRTKKSNTSYLVKLHLSHGKIMSLPYGKSSIVKANSIAAMFAASLDVECLDGKLDSKLTSHWNKETGKRELVYRNGVSSWWIFSHPEIFIALGIIFVIFLLMWIDDSTNPYIKNKNIIKTPDVRLKKRAVTNKKSESVKREKKTCKGFECPSLGLSGSKTMTRYHVAMILGKIKDLVPFV
ncbi:hypothetical protein KAJ27_05165 [bacterium]|nr:hypothetical protein [bacterium]